jgi:hypothetical protein
LVAAVARAHSYCERMRKKKNLGPNDPCPFVDNIRNIYMSAAEARGPVTSRAMQV